MLSQIEEFVNYIRRRNAQARAWRDYRGDLGQFAAMVGDCAPGAVTFCEVDRFVTRQQERGFKPAAGRAADHAGCLMML
jgi:hypothetical protein